MNRLGRNVALLQTIIHPTVTSEMSRKQEGQNFAHIDT